MSTRKQLEANYYSDFIEQSKGMKYIKDEMYSYWDPSDIMGNAENDYTTYTVEFEVIIDGKSVLVKAFKSSKRTSYRKTVPTYKGYVLTPNVIYVESTNKWYFISDDLLTDAIKNRDTELVTGLLEYSENFSKKFLYHNIIELLEGASPAKKKRKRKN